MRNSTLVCAVALLSLCLATTVQGQQAGCGYIAATWGDSSVHILTNGLVNVSSFTVGADPNGIATDGTTIWTGHFVDTTVRAYSTTGTFLYSWSAASLSGLQGMEYVGSNTLAIYSNNQIEFRNALTGALINSIPAQSSVEGLAYDGTYLYQLGDSIFKTDPATGTVVDTITNPASNCAFGGSGLAFSGPNELTVGCAGGDWYKINATTGAVLTSGNNALDMYGLKSFCAAAPAAPAVPALSGRSLAALAALLGAMAVFLLRARV